LRAAYKVVVLPEPVGPVVKIKPLGALKMLLILFNSQSLKPKLFNFRLIFQGPEGA